MVKWGFDYGYLNSMPLDEYYEYLDLINKHNREKETAARAVHEGHAPRKAPDPKPIGMVAPRKQ